MCFGSKADRDGLAAARPISYISSPQDVTTPKSPPGDAGTFPSSSGTDGSFSKPEIHATQLEHSFQIMAVYLKTRGVPVTAVVSGSAVNAVLLRTRATSSGVRVFGAGLDDETRKVLDEAIQHAQRNSAVDLSPMWFSIDAGDAVAEETQRELTEQAMAQKAVIFSRQGLTLLAAPWEYALAESLGNSDDMEDAADYLHQIVMRDRSAVPRSKIQQWAAKYGCSANMNLLSRLNRAYVHQYGRSAIL